VAGWSWGGGMDRCWSIRNNNNNNTRLVNLDFHAASTVKFGIRYGVISGEGFSPLLLSIYIYIHISEYTWVYVFIRFLLV